MNQLWPMDPILLLFSGCHDRQHRKNHPELWGLENRPTLGKIFANAIKIGRGGKQAATVFLW